MSMPKKMECGALRPESRRRFKVRMARKSISAIFSTAPLAPAVSQNCSCSATTSVSERSST